MGTSFRSATYPYELEIARTPSGALDYFFSTPLGLAILIAVFLLIVASLP